MAQNQLIPEEQNSALASSIPAIPTSAPPVGTNALPKPELMPTAPPTPPPASTFDAPSQPKPVAHTAEVQSNQTVSGQLKELLSSDSPYLEQGRQVGLTQASQRGLQNSTMAIQAGEQARIAAALPIAQQDASRYAEQATLNQNTENAFRTSELDHLQSLTERAQQGDINAQLQMDQFGFNSALSAQQNIQALQQQAMAGDIQAQQRFLDFSYSTMLSGIQHGQALELNDQQFQNAQTILMQEFANASGLSAQDAQQRVNELNAQHQNTLEEIANRSSIAINEQGINLGFQLQAQYLGQVASRQQAASEEIRIIMQTQGLTPAQQSAGVNSVRTRMETDILALQVFYASSPQWNDDFASPTFGIPDPGTGGGTDQPVAPTAPDVSPNDSLPPGFDPNDFNFGF